ncbi:nucleotidyltransferase family protein [Spiribacter halobius]|uniref:Nucleotidyltransferase family protein n=1 Tax=Sediminicurvatus halobius TaxID=2182432 RepID=A0A2U2N082_9GAMM|nr:nucleotidyltransferase family protein [Spiribacter halobius]PWG62606.1 nucleotidyltransferase family protein [Spiribacter halobius]UEX78475.1 nucleotidyltransferase family protein [Spiribacter halobius]
MICALLLAGGRGERFGGDKLAATLADGTPVALAASRPLLAGCDRVLAVLRPGREALGERLQAEGCELLVSPCTRQGMGASLAAGVAATPEAGAWLVALADMPLVAPATVAELAARLRAGAGIVMPEYDGRRGHPVGFAARFGPALRALAGDTGARRVVRAHPGCVVTVPVADPGILRDVDTPADLAAMNEGGDTRDDG